MNQINPLNKRFAVIDIFALRGLNKAIIYTTEKVQIHIDRIESIKKIYDYTYVLAEPIFFRCGF